MTTVKIEMDGAVGVVSLAKPPHNLIDDAMIADLLAAYRDVVGQRRPRDRAQQRDASLFRGCGNELVF